MKRSLVCIALCGVCALFAVGAEAQTVEVFTNSAIYLQHTGGATVYLLDGLQQLEAELSRGLPGNPEQATAIARERMRRIGVAELQRRASNAAEGIVRARQYGIDRAPAVVFDGRSVVYGVTDIAQALEIYRRSQAMPLPPRAAGPLGLNTEEMR